FAGRLAALASHPAVAAVRHLGGMAALELAPATATATAATGVAGATGAAGAAGAAGGYLDDLGPRLAARLLERGLLLRPLGNVLYLLPPYVIEDAEAEGAFDAIAAVLDG
ncbi:MAG TPA: aminotransferase class III-fold pyridoxal phosphate-dependent enzyme, partial [Thermoanaerobaculia bacterium]|nr:aminotransferase class III-fold pyridoxal phosphate-dependent enzyme [Thermoanaerobaculia bacterium]